MVMDSNDTLNIQEGRDARKVFWEKGACSTTFFHLLNRAFGNVQEEAERAAMPLAGGIMQKGHQCGMLWGAAMAIGAEVYRQDPKGDVVGKAMNATQQVMRSFESHTGTISCREFTHCNFDSKWSMAKYMLTGKFLDCFRLAEEWAPQAIAEARKGIAMREKSSPDSCISCASEVVRKMGGTDEQMAIVAGLAGGLGLSGHGCGALAAAIWMHSLRYNAENASNKMALANPPAEKCLERFLEKTHGMVHCQIVSGKTFETIEDHTEFIKKGGCAEIIEVLVET